MYLTLHLVSMRAGGWTDVDFDQLAAVSGASALFAYQHGEFMPKYSNLSIGMDQRIADATGYGYEWVGFEGVDGAWGLLVESVDSGRPVKGWDWENILFAGYRDAPQRRSREVFAMADGPDTFAKWLTWEEFGNWVDRVQGWGCPQLGRHTQRVPMVPARDVALQVIAGLVEWSTEPPPVLLEKYPEARFGLVALEAYAADCANIVMYEDWSACHDVNPQWAVRNSTAVYLNRIAESRVFPADVTARLLAGAAHYRAGYAEWQEFYERLGHNAPEDAGRTEACRLAGAEAVRRALARERAGIDELRRALAVCR